MIESKGLHITEEHKRSKITESLNLIDQLMDIYYSLAKTGSLEPNEGWIFGEFIRCVEEIMQEGW